MFGRATFQRSFTPPPPFVVFKNNDDFNRKQMMRTKTKTIIIESRIRPGRQVEQRKFRMEREKESLGDDWGGKIGSVESYVASDDAI
jgi:hypothetical protein